MLSRKNRLSKQADFDAVFQKGKSQGNRNLAIFFGDNRQKDYRFAVVVSAKVAKGAVSRNRFRRRAYQIFGKGLGLMKGEPKDVILVAKAPALELSFEGLEKNISSILKKGGLYA